MMTKKIILIAAAALVSISCLYFSISAYIRYSEHYVKVYVTSHQLYQRKQLEEEDLELIEAPREYLGNDVYTDKEDIIGKYVKLSCTLPKGSLIYKGSLEDDIRDLAGTYLKPGEVNFDIYTGEAKINSGSLGVGMNVGIYLTITTNDKPIADLLMNNCRITGLYDSQGRRIAPYDSDTRVQIVSLAIRKEYVNILNKALVVGSLSIISGSDTYDTDLDCSLNEESAVLEYLQ